MRKDILVVMFDIVFSRGIGPGKHGNSQRRLCIREH